MKVAASCWRKLSPKQTVYDWMFDTMQRTADEHVALLVFPALIGNLFLNSENFVEKTIELSKMFPNTLICPGSYWERVGEVTYHTSFVVHKGDILWHQRQLYLAKWEKDVTISRGDELIVFSYEGINMAIILGTDVFYPQVARYAAMQGVQIVLSPVALLKPTSYAKQLSGVWQNVQQNLFFAIESAFNDRFSHYYFEGISQIHAPLELTEDDHGLLAKSNNEMITATLPLEQLDWARRFYNPLRQLNKTAYKTLFE